VAQLAAVNARARVEAESMADQRGVEIDFAIDGGKRVGVAVTALHDQDWIGYSQLDFGAGISAFEARVAAATGPSTIDISLDGCPAFNGAAGTVLGSCEVPATGGRETWVDVHCGTERVTGVHDLCLRFRASRADELFDFDYFQFE
jgi:arabinoxylan arabinofuranohydrolase